MMYERCIKLLEPEGGQWIQLCVYCEMEPLFELGQRIGARFEPAYMNGYNWDALIRYYVGLNDSELMAEVQTDPEAGMFTAFMSDSTENWQKMRRLEGFVRTLVNDEAELLAFIGAHLDDIEWD